MSTLRRGAGKCLILYRPICIVLRLIIIFDRAMLATNPTFDVGFLTDAIEETSHIRFDIPAPDIEQDAMGDDDAEGEIDDEIQKD